MINLEAMISFLCFLAILGVFVGLLNLSIQEALDKGEFLRARLSAEKCSSIIDAFYANSGGEIIDLEIDCTMQQGEIIAEENGRRGKAAILNNKTKLLQLGTGTIIEVGVGEHYER